MFDNVYIIKDRCLCHEWHVCMKFKDNKSKFVDFLWLKYDIS